MILRLPVLWRFLSLHYIFIFGKCRECNRNFCSTLSFLRQVVIINIILYFVSKEMKQRTDTFVISRSYSGPITVNYSITCKSLWTIFLLNIIPLRIIVKVSGVQNEIIRDQECHSTLCCPGAIIPRLQYQKWIG